MGMSGLLHTSVILPTEMELTVPIRQKGEPLSWSQCDEKYRNPCPCQELNPGNPASSQSV